MTIASTLSAWRPGLRPVVATFAAIVACFLLIPILVIIPISFTSAQFLKVPPPGYSLQWYQEIISRPEWYRALMVSLRVGVLSMVLSLVLGVSAAIALTRTRFRGKTLIYSLVLSPMIIPTVIIGLGSFFLFSRLHLTGTTFGIAIAHAVLCCPIVVIIVSSGLQSFNIRIEQAAIILGASPLRAFLQITVPNIAPSIISAGLFAFLLSFDEVLVSLFMTDPATVTIPIQIWNYAILHISPVIAAVSVFLMAVTLLILALAGAMNRLAARRTKRA